MLIVTGALTSIITISWLEMTTLPAQMAFAALFGLFSGGLVPLGSACVAQTTSNLGHIGLRIGGMMAICSVGGLIGGPISGVLRDTAAGWTAVFSFAAGITMLGSLSLIWVRLSWNRTWRSFY